MTTQQEINYELLLKIVEKSFTATRNEFLRTGPGSRQDFNKYPRFVFIYILRRYAGFKTIELGEVLGWNHSSIVHAANVVRDTLMRDVKYKKKVDECKIKAEKLGLQVK